MSRVRLYRVQGIVIRQRDLGEADRVVLLLTPERGKISAIAKGARRPRSKLAGGLQLFCQGHFQLAAGRSLEVVTQAQPADPCYRLREDMDRYTHACYVAELVDALTEEGHPVPGVFSLVAETLGALDQGGDPGTLVRGFEVNLLRALGYGPELDTCVSCGTEVEGGRAGFSAAEGGALCRRCVGARGAAPLSPGALRAMRDLAARSPAELLGRRLAGTVSQELERLLRAYVDYRLERPLRSASFLAR